MEQLPALSCFSVLAGCQQCAGSTQHGCCSSQRAGNSADRWRGRSCSDHINLCRARWMSIINYCWGSVTDTQQSLAAACHCRFVCAVVFGSRTREQDVLKQKKSVQKGTVAPLFLYWKSCLSSWGRAHSGRLVMDIQTMCRWALICTSPPNLQRSLSFKIHFPSLWLFLCEVFLCTCGCFLTLCGHLAPYCDCCPSFCSHLMSLCSCVVSLWGRFVYLCTCLTFFVSVVQMWSFCS